MKVNFEIVNKKPTTHKWWVYVHTTPDGMNYVGVSSLEYTSQRWQPSHYKRSSLEPYIEQYGWDAIEHTVVAYLDNEKLALLYEEALMNEFSKQGTLINKQGSGGHYRDKDEVFKAANHKYKQSEQGKAVQRKASAKRRATPEGKIYNRVAAYNHYHPDRIIETPMEAKQKYLETGYIPPYINNKDLK